uniref:Uncharacterized protein n=1 Tax=Anguilla anguilla TaxID=7936 RepID=A0A0E9R9V7_ANGAN
MQIRVLLSHSLRAPPSNHHISCQGTSRPK